MNNTHPTREGWLLNGAALLRTHVLQPNNLRTDMNVRCSCGFARGARRAIGQCWPAKNSDATHEIFVCPSIDEPVRVLDVLLHELLHASVGLENKHQSVFKRAALACGLAGKPTATYAAPGTALHTQLQAFAGELGPYPHTALAAGAKARRSIAQPRRMRLVSINEPSYNISLPINAMEEFGAPVDPWGDIMVEEEE